MVIEIVTAVSVFITISLPSFNGFRGKLTRIALFTYLLYYLVECMMSSVISFAYFRPTSFPGSSLCLEKVPGCGWSRVYVYKSNPHRGWIFDLIWSTLSMEEKVALLLYLES